MKRIQKGEFGYIGFQRKWTLVRTILYFALCAAIFLTGYITTKTRANLLTIVAILGCLPACKSVVNVIMFYRAKGCSVEAHDAIDNIAVDIAGLYDMYMTSYKNNYQISHLAIKGNIIVGYTEDKNSDVNMAEKHIDEHLKQDGYKNMTVKIYTDITKYTERLKQLNELDASPLKNQDFILEMLLAISL